jgi:hypothetical protein
VWHLSDPHAQEYGVSGHLQSGIDIISRRNGDLSRHVGVQCKHVKKLKIADIREDTNAALAIDPPLSEMIFATTDDSDPKIIAFAAQLEQEIRTDGRVIQICIYDWQKIESIVVQRPDLHALFDPRVIVSSPWPDPRMARPRRRWARLRTHQGDLPRARSWLFSCRGGAEGVRRSAESPKASQREERRRRIQSSPEDSP